MGVKHFGNCVVGESYSEALACTVFLPSDNIASSLLHSSRLSPIVKSHLVRSNVPERKSIDKKVRERLRALAGM